MTEPDPLEGLGVQNPVAAVPAQEAKKMMASSALFYFIKDLTERP